MPDNNPELIREIEELKGEFNILKSHIDEQDKTLAEHQHTGADGSFRITDADIVLKDRHAILSGLGGMVGEGKAEDAIKRLHFALGPEGIGSGTIGKETRNMQLTFDYSPSLNFIYGLSDAVSNICSTTVSSIQTTLTDPATDFGADNSRVGQYLLVIREVLSVSDYRDYSYVITANTKHSITISSGFGFSGRIVEYLVYKPIYFGSSFTQFKKIYTLDGLRFGPGASYNGQNALLFMDSAGALKYKKLNGDEETIVAA